MKSIRRIGPAIPYEDGSEDRILEILKSTPDRQSWSSNLANSATDWATRYHFSRQRAHLLRIFQFSPQMRILEIGAGSGPLTRFLGETGAEVTALEGAYRRAESIAVRCADLDNVEVLCGDLQDLEEPKGFDLVVAIGVLEYSEAESGGSGSASDFLRRVYDLLKPNGQAILALENQLGVKYLAGGSEDHWGQPWVGLIDYPGGPSVRTWTRRELQANLERAGFESTQWFYPYPDYKLPRVILGHSAFGEPGAEILADRFIRHHLVRHPAEIGETFSPRQFSERAFHRVALKEGLGPQLACSFLILARRGSEAPPMVEESSRIWLFEDERAGDCSSLATIERHEDTLRYRHQPWPFQAPARRSSRSLDYLIDPFDSGPSFEQLMLEAIAHHDGDSLRRLFDNWKSWVQVQEEEGDWDLASTGYSASGMHQKTPRGWGDFSLSWEDRVLLSLWRLLESIRVSAWPHPWEDDLEGGLSQCLGLQVEEILEAGRSDSPAAL